MTTTPSMTVGDLSANDIGTTRLILQHEGSTLSGVLNALRIQSEHVTDSSACGETRSYLVAVGVTVTIGSITVGPLTRDHACEVIS